MWPKHVVQLLKLNVFGSAVTCCKRMISWLSKNSEKQKQDLRMNNIIMFCNYYNVNNLTTNQLLLSFPEHRFYNTGTLLSLNFCKFYLFCRYMEPHYNTDVGVHKKSVL